MPEQPSQSDVRKSLLKYATFCLSRRPYFEGTLRRKLVLRAKKINFKESSAVISDLLKDLKKAGFLDDLYLAQAFVRRQLDKCYGPKIIFLKLSRLNLDKDTINLALEEASIEKQVDAIRKISLRYSNLDKYKITSKLYGRGFGTQVIKKLFDVEYVED